jgi:hypothetical protein
VAAASRRCPHRAQRRDASATLSTRDWPVPGTEFIFISPTFNHTPKGRKDGFRSGSTRALADGILNHYRKCMGFKDVAGEGASHDTRGRVCSPACFVFGWQTASLSCFSKATFGHKRAQPPSPRLWRAKKSTKEAGNKPQSLRSLRSLAAKAFLWPGCVNFAQSPVCFYCFRWRDWA